MMAKLQKYAVDEIVWAVDSGKVYKSKIIKAFSNGDAWKYFIHFQGWRTKYDIWVNDNLLAREGDEKGKRKLEGGFETAVAAKGKKSKIKSEKKGTETAEAEDFDGLEEGLNSGLSSSSAAIPVAKRKTVSNEDMLAAKKRRRDFAQQDLIDEYSIIDGGEYTSKILIPLNFKRHLVDEWSLVTGINKRLINLPRPITVANIIDEFLEQKEKKIDSEQFSIYKDLFEGFLMYFDKALPFILLYRQEREQFETAQALFNDEIIPSEFYGGEHLIRLFVRLQRMLLDIFIPQADMVQVVVKMTEFLKWMEKNKDRFIVIGDYTLADQAMETLKSMDLESFIEKSKNKTLPSVSKVIKIVKEEKVVVSEITGRPIRNRAGENKNNEDF